MADQPASGEGALRHALSQLASQPPASGKCLIVEVLPLEMRWKIYECVAQRPEGSHLILKEYLERKDPNIPDPAPPAASAAVDDEGDSEEEEEGEADEGAEEADEESEDEEMDGTTSTAAAGSVPASTNVTTTTQAAATPATILEAATTQATQGAEEGESEHDDDDEDEDMDSEDDVDGGDEEEAEGEVEAADEDGTAAISAASAQPLRSTGRSTKYRHMIKTITISACPPTVGLLQTSKQIYDEALDHHLRTCVLTIDVMRGFSHYSFFKETLQLFQDHAFSPIEQIRKINLVIAWDSEWISSKSSGSQPELEDTFPFTYYLGKRIRKTAQMLSKCPSLRRLTVHWFDTERTPESEALMNENLTYFRSLTDKAWFDQKTEESG